MKYAIIKCSNGSFAVESEWSDLTKAKVRFHAVCQTLWNTSDVVTAEVMIMDEQLNCVEGYKEFIDHRTPEESAEENAEEVPAE